MPNQKKAKLKKDFFSGKINAIEFMTSLEETFRYRGFHVKPGRRPRWSGPFRDTRREADIDNAPYFNEGFNVDVYIEQM